MTNETIIQYFHWYSPGNGVLWKDFARQAGRLAALGITMAWLPPASKGGSGGASVGYDVYDLFDLGEFDQQGTIRTKYGTKEEYVKAIAAAHRHGIRVIADTVLNHKAHGDELEKVMARKVNPSNRTEFISEPIEITAWTKFHFPGRNKKHSEFIWDFHCFSGVDWAENLKEAGVYKILNEYGDQWEQLAEEEYGNFDYLSFADIEYRNQAVREEVKYWGKWFLDTTGIDGFRLDAVKHITPAFLNEWIDHIKSMTGKQVFFMGEYWNDRNAEILKKFIDVTGGRMQLVDAPLHNNFSRLSGDGRDYDLSAIFHNTLTALHPELSITFLSNHDSQPLQLLEKPIADWSKPLVYALMLLREQGTPCVFYPDLFGASYTDKGKDGHQHDIVLNRVAALPAMIKARNTLAYGLQRDYFDHKTTVGWTREGTGDKRMSGLAVLMSCGDDGWKNMQLGKRNAGKTFVDALGGIDDRIVLHKDGSAEFRCKGGSVAMWIDQQAVGYVAGDDEEIRDALNPRSV